MMTGTRGILGRWGSAVAGLLLLVSTAEAQRISPSGGSTTITTSTATDLTGLLLGNGADVDAYAGTSCTNQFPRSLNASGVATCASVANADLAGSIAASKLVGTDIATVGTITTGTWNAGAVTSSGSVQAASGSQLLISTDTGIRRDAAGSLSFTDGSTGHATGVGVGTTTPRTINGLAFGGNHRAIHVESGVASAAVLAASGVSHASVFLTDTDATANQKTVGLRSVGMVLELSRWADGLGSSVDYLTANLATDVVTLGSASVVGLTASWGTGGGIALTDSANGKAVNIKQITESHTLAAAGTSDTTIQFPANAVILGVAVRVTTEITGCATFQVGDSGSATRYGTGLALTAGTTNQSGGTTNPTIPGAAQSIRFTCVGGGASFTAGVVRVVGYYIDMTAPTSMLPALDMMRQIAAADPQLRRAA